MTRSAGDSRFYDGKRRYWRSSSLWLAIVSGVFVLALIAAVVVLAVLRDEPAALGVSVAQLNANPDEYVGEQVTVSGNVDALLGQQAFIMGGPDFPGGQILVVAEEPLSAVVPDEAQYPFSPSDIVQVTGEVRRLDQAELGTTLGDDDRAEFDGELVVVAQSIVATPRAGDTLGGLGVDVRAIASQPQQFYGWRVTTSGYVLEVLDAEAVVLAAGDESEAGSSLLVVGGPDVMPEVEEGTFLQVSGIVQRLDQDSVGQATGDGDGDEAPFEQGYLDQDLFDDYRDGPVLFAENVLILGR